MHASLRAALIVVLVVLLAGPARASAQASDPGAIVDAFDTALNAGNVEATLALFTDDATVRAQEGTYTGKAQLRALFTELVQQHTQFDSGNRQVRGDTETHTANVSRDDWRSLGLAWLDASATVVVRGGKIASFTVSYTPDSAARLRAAQARGGAAPAPAQLPTALPRTGDARSPLAPFQVGGLAGAGIAALLAGLALVRPRRTSQAGRQDGQEEASSR